MIRIKRFNLKIVVSSITCEKTGVLTTNEFENFIIRFDLVNSMSNKAFLTMAKEKENN